MVTAYLPARIIASTVKRFNGLTCRNIDLHQLSIPPRGIHFSPFPDQLSGANRSLLTLVEELAKRGPVYVLTLCEGALATEARKVGATVLDTT